MFPPARAGGKTESDVCVFPFAHGGKGVDRVPVFQMAEFFEPFHDIFPVCPQKRVGGFFQTDGRRQGRTAAVALGEVGSGTFGDRFVAGFDFPGEFQVGERIFVSGKDLYIVRQGSQSGEGRPHLFRCAFEHPAATGTEQHVTAKEPFFFWGIIGDVTSGMPGNVKYGQIGAVLSEKGDGIAFLYRMGDGFDGVQTGAIHGDTGLFQQFGDAADMVFMAVSQ